MRRNPRSMSARGGRAGRRAFSMLEMVMAAAIGSLVIIVCISVFYTMERAEEMLARRAAHASDLERLRFVAQRATTTLVMSTDRLPATPRAGEGETEAASRFGQARTSENGALAPIPRVILHTDPRAQGWVMRSTGGRDFQADASPVQRIEFVLSDPPVPTEDNDFFLRAGLRPGERVTRRDREAESRFSNRSRFSEESRFSGKQEDATKSPDEVRSKNSGTKSAANDPSIQKADGLGEAGAEEQGSVRAIRGALEVRPQEATARELRTAAADNAPPPEAYEVWWVPLPPRANGSEPPTAEEIARAGTPFKVAGNLRFVKWRMFDDRTWKDELEATWEQQLPAYIELSAETTSGMTAKWMFEVDWARGPEVPPTPNEGVRRAEAVDEGGSSSGGASSGGTPSRTTGGTPGRPTSKTTPSRPTRPATPKATPIPPPASKSGGKP